MSSRTVGCSSWGRRSGDRSAARRSSRSSAYATTWSARACGLPSPSPSTTAGRSSSGWGGRTRVTLPTRSRAGCRSEPPEAPFGRVVGTSSPLCLCCGTRDFRFGRRAVARSARPLAESYIGTAWARRPSRAAISLSPPLSHSPGHKRLGRTLADTRDGRPPSTPIEGAQTFASPQGAVVSGA